MPEQVERTGIYRLANTCIESDYFFFTGSLGDFEINNFKLPLVLLCLISSGLGQGLEVRERGLLLRCL